MMSSGLIQPSVFAACGQQAANWEDGWLDWFHQIQLYQAIFFVIPEAEDRQHHQRTDDSEICTAEWFSYIPDDIPGNGCGKYNAQCLGISGKVIPFECQIEDLDRAISEKRSRLNKEKGSELLNAAVGWATWKSKALKNEIEDLRCEISTHEETIERLQDKIQTIQNDHSRELMQLETKHRSELNRKETEHTQETTRLKNQIA